MCGGAKDNLAAIIFFNLVERKIMRPAELFTTIEGQVGWGIGNATAVPVENGKLQFVTQADAVLTHDPVNGEMLFPIESEPLEKIFILIVDNNAAASTSILRLMADGTTHLAYDLPVIGSKDSDTD